RKPVTSRAQRRDRPAEPSLFHMPLPLPPRAPAALPQTFKLMPECELCQLHRGFSRLSISKRLASALAITARQLQQPAERAREFFSYAQLQAGAAAGRALGRGRNGLSWSKSN